MKVSRSKKALRVHLSMLALAVAGTLLVLWSCAPDSGFSTVADYDTIMTLYASDADYTSMATYAMTDSVDYIQDPEDDSEIERNPELEELIFDTIADNMEDIGHSRVTEPDPENPPDLYIAVRVASTEWSGAYYPWYAWRWCPYYPCGPGWG